MYLLPKTCSDWLVIDSITIFLFVETGMTLCGTNLPSLMNTAERLHRNSHLSVPLAITEAIRLYKPELTKVLVKRKPQENNDE